ncbi:related to JmjC domain protein [Ramularia collo-cygni]|uniref:Related to JmjC domain protein n=1 Tax=Ramularia collo-cygni TaxID=112498 RepID=A0A2D3VFK7_9PEZI|nr:related to JmjC domain protein [Ramularia collo-cygni]CZT24685.1 related to JmjC domain protein [Ramularia collo-cygni]
MPAQRPRASFEPIAPTFDLKELVEKTANFSYADRISCDTIEQQGLVAFEKLITMQVIVGGKPLVIDGFDDLLDPWTFTPKWLRDNCGEKVENARNLTAKENLPLSMGHYLKNMGLLTNQFFDKPGAYREKGRQRVYLKDIDCPAVWWDKLKDHIPGSVSYLNDSTGEPGGPGAIPDPTSNIPGRRLGRGIARAGDLMSSLPPDMRAENLQCYIGHEGTYTPAHREMCASLGQNIMVEASGTVSDDGRAEKPGSSIWFMTESKDRHMVSEYFLSVLGHDIEVENHFAQVVAWKKAPFSVYIVEQRPGDFILIPPLAPHQVWNRGTRTMKVAWNRTTVETLEMALNEALPRSRIVCRDEQYKNKAIVYYTLQKYASLLTLAQTQAKRIPGDAASRHLYSGKIKQLIKDFKRLFNMYKQIMLSESFHPDDREAIKAEYVPYDSNVTCAYCRGNIFNRFLTCGHCKDLLGHDTDEGDPYDVCMDCYAMGRSCACISGLKWVEQFRWKELTNKYDAWRRIILELDGGQTDKTPLPLLEERRRLTKKTLAEVCKDQLKRRPFKDVKKPESKSDDESDEEIIVGDDGQVKKILKKKSKTFLKNNLPCHVCCHRHPVWKMAKCTTCERSWCYGSLFRGWDKMPLQIMEDPDWTCPHCLGICFAGACKKEGKMKTYEPKGTLLGHDTKKVADARSVEALVDFSVSNLNWLKDDLPEKGSESRRLQRARAEAEKNKGSGAIDDDDDSAAVDVTQVEMEYSPNATPIDPALMSGALPEDEETRLAHQLRLANAALLPPPAAMVAGAAPDGYAPLPAAGYSGFAPTASMYPQPDDGSSNYVYPGQHEESPSGDNMDSLRPFKKRQRSGHEAAGDDDFDGDISMQKAPKQKKPRLMQAGFRSFDLAENATGPSASKAKNEAQRQFEKEKERKALEKAKADGRFIILQAAIKGKHRHVVLRVPGARLAQLLAVQAAKAAIHGDDIDAEHEHEHDDTTIAPLPGPTVHFAQGDADEQDAGSLLKSDIAPKKTPSTIREERERKMRDGIVLTGNTKKALVPVEKDETYGYRPREKQNGKWVAIKEVEPTAASAKGKRNRESRGGHVEYEEIDIGSDDDGSGVEERDGFNAINGGRSRASGSNSRRSLPGYLNDRTYDGPDQLPDTFRDGDVHGSRAGRPKKKRTSDTAHMEAAMRLTEAALTSPEPAVAAKSAKPNGARTSSFGGKQPSMRPSNGSGNAPIELSDGNPSSSDDEEAAPTPAPAPASAPKINKSSGPSAAQRAQAEMDEANRLAKLQAFAMVDGGDDLFDESDDDGEEEIPARKVQI